MLEKGPLFRNYDEDSQKLNEAHHLAAIAALTGNPPAAFLERSKKAAQFWNEDGT